MIAPPASAAVAIEDPPGFVVRTEAQKAAGDNGYRLERGIAGGWLHYGSTTAPGLDLDRRHLRAACFQLMEKFAERPSHASP
jgi:hypothetical protein